jgi:hypothetical protein
MKGLKFYSKDGAIVLKTAIDIVSETQTVYLEDGERVIGYKSRIDPEKPNAYHNDFQLIIGRLI